MEKHVKTSRRNFINTSTRAAAATVGLLSLEWQKVIAEPATGENKSVTAPPPSLPIRHIPLQSLGLTAIPAVPFVIDGILTTLGLLGARGFEVLQAKNGLNNNFTIRQQTETGYAFMYGKTATSQVPANDRDALLKLLQTADLDTILQPAFVKALLQASDRTAVSLNDDPITKLSLDTPGDFALSLTNFYNIYQKASASLVGSWSASLVDATAATEQFWPTIAKYGLPYNLLFLKKVNHQQLNRLRQDMNVNFTNHFNLDGLATTGDLYAIDLTIFNTLDVKTVEESPRFTPGTFTLLQQDPATKNLTPITIVVTGKNGAGAQTFVRGLCTDSAWLYALQAAKVGATVYGIWIGHVYHYHITTASMVMTLYNNIPAGSPLFSLLDKQSRYLIEFNEVLLLLWRSIAPPSSVSSGWQLLELMNTFATGRNFFDDDPPATFNNQGLRAEDFTTGTQPWNKYPIAGQAMDLWRSTASYVTAFVNATYANDAAVTGDSSLQAWMTAAGDVNQGNIKGLPTMNTKTALINVLTSFLYRITAHGSSRLIDSANPSLAFVANFPPCLQKSAIPLPSVNLTTKQLLEYLPKTGTIGEMMNFYFIFAFSAPYDSFIPVAGIDTDLFFAGGVNDPRNKALLQYRRDLMAFIRRFTADAAVPGSPPDTPQFQQWPTNIET